MLSTDDTVMAGTLSARGGRASGNGGNVEVSGTLGLALVGRVDVTAAHGSAGGLTIDPTDLIVQSGGNATLTGGVLDVEPPPANNTAIIDPNVLQAATGNVTLISSDNLDVRSGFSLNSNGLLTMTATHGAITVGGAITNDGGGITMSAGSDIFINAPITAAGALNITAVGAITQAAGAAITSTGSFIALSAGGAITLGANVATSSAPAAGSLNLKQATGVSQTGGSITTPGLFSSLGPGLGGALSGSVTLQQNANSIQALGPFAVTRGNIALVDASPTLTVSGAVSTIGSGVISLSGGTVVIDAPITAADALALVASGPLTQNPGGPIASSNNAIALSSGGTITLGDNVTTSASARTGSLNIEKATQVVQTGGAIMTPALFSSFSDVGGAVAGPVSLLAHRKQHRRAWQFRRLRGRLRAGRCDADADHQRRAAGTGSGRAPRLPRRASCSERNAAINAPGGVVALAPLFSAATLGADPGGFAITQAELAQITTGLLRIGAANGMSAASVTLAGGFDTRAFATLELDSTGGIAINAGSAGCQHPAAGWQRQRDAIGCRAGGDPGHGGNAGRLARSVQYRQHDRRAGTASPPAAAMFGSAPAGRCV